MLDPIAEARPMLDLRPDAPRPGAPSPAERLGLVRQRTEAVFGATLEAMLGALEDLGVAEASLVSLADLLSPAAMERLQSLQPKFQDLGARVEAKAERSRAAARLLDRLMAGGRNHLDELRRLARTATLVSLNALVVSRSLSSDGGTLDGLARNMRSVLGEVGGLVSDLGIRIAAGQAELARVESEAASLARLAQAEALPAIGDFAELVLARARDDRVARAAGRVSLRLQALQERVGQVVLHLQVGDSFRQRIEHVEAILAAADEPGRPEAGPALRLLAAAQIRAALEDLGHSSQKAIRHLRSLGQTAADVPRAGAIDALRGGGRDGLDTLIAASARLDGIIGGLTGASNRLSVASRGLAATLADAGQNAEAAAEFERRMTVLGLNAILLASRLGPEGRAMEAVAQQQRDIARGLIGAMAQLRRDLEGVVVTAGDLEGPADEALAAELRAAADAAAEVTDLSERVKALLAVMASVRGAGEIAEQMGQARRELERFADLASGLAQVAGALERGPAGCELGEDAQPLLARLRGLYSMQAERDVHDRLFPRAEGLAAPGATDPAPEEDILFG